MPSPDAPWDDRVRYAVDPAGRYFTYRPDELIVHVDALDDLADLVAVDIVAGDVEAQDEPGGPAAGGEEEPDPEPPAEDVWPDAPAPQVAAQAEGERRMWQDVAGRVGQQLEREWP